MVQKENHSKAVKDEIKAIQDSELENKSEALARLERIRKIRRRKFWESCKLFKAIQGCTKCQ